MPTTFVKGAEKLTTYSEGCGYAAWSRSALSTRNT